MRDEGSTPYFRWGLILSTALTLAPWSALAQFHNPSCEKIALVRQKQLPRPEQKLIELSKLQGVCRNSLDPRWVQRFNLWFQEVSDDAEIQLSRTHCYDAQLSNSSSTPAAFNNLSDSAFSASEISEAKATVSSVFYDFFWEQAKQTHQLLIEGDRDIRGQLVVYRNGHDSRKAIYHFIDREVDGLIRGYDHASWRVDGLAQVGMNKAINKMFDPMSNTEGLKLRDKIVSRWDAATRHAIAERYRVEALTLKKALEGECKPLDALAVARAKLRLNRSPVAHYTNKNPPADSVSSTTSGSSIDSSAAETRSGTQRSAQ